MKPHPYSLRQLQYAIAVAEELSFRRAAERCRVSQPSLSAQLAQLEDALGVRLFERDAKKVLPTAAGRELVERARRVLLEADDLVEAARRAADPRAGTLAIGVIPTVSPYLLPQATPALKKSFDRLTFVWIEEKTAVIVERLGSGALDAAIVALETELGDFERAVIAKDPFVLVTARDHPLAARSSPASAQELAGVGVLLLDDGHCFREQALAFCGSAKATELEFRATSLSTLVQMVAGGTGVTLLPALSIATETKRAELHVRPFKKPAPERTIALIWRKHSPFGAVLNEIARVLSTTFASGIAGRDERPGSSPLRPAAVRGANKTGDVKR